MLEEKMGHYTLEQRIGKGTFATVYKARKGENTYAIKVVDRRILNDPANLRAFERETRLYLQMAHHPNIIHAIEVVHTEMKVGLVEELCGGGDLGTAIFSNFPMVRLHIRHISLGILNALTFIRDRNLAHRDLKPDNILLTEDFTPKLCDFGLVCESNVLRDTICGTPYYCAPEMNEGLYDPCESDIWSFGILLYQMASGFLPWKSKSIVALRNEVQHPENIEYSTFIEADAQEAIKKCLVVDPSKRATIDDLRKMKFFRPPPLLSKHNGLGGHNLNTFSKGQKYAAGTLSAYQLLKKAPVSPTRILPHSFSQQRIIE